MDPEKKTRLGNRFTCFGCGIRFYDLNKPEPICPKCGADQRETPEPEKPKTKKRARKSTKKAKKKKAAINPALVEDEVATTKEESIEELDLESSDDIQLEVDSD